MMGLEKSMVEGSICQNLGASNRTPVRKTDTSRLDKECRKEERGVCVRDERNTLLSFLASFLLVIIGYTKIYSIATKYEFGPVRFET